MKLSVFIISLLLISSIIAKSVAISDANNFFKGFLSGAQIFIPNFETCIGEDSDIGNQIIIAILNIKSGNLATDLSSLKNVGAALEEFPKALIQCNTTQQDIDQLKSLIDAIVHPTSDIKILKNIFSQREAIESQLSSCIKCAKSQDFECVGQQLGSMLNNLVIREATLYNEQDNLDIIVVNNVSNSFLKGYLYGIGVRSIDFYTCLFDSKTIANIVYDALDEYESKNYLQALVKVGQAVVNLPGMMVRCNATQEDIDLAKNSAEWFLNPSQNIKDLWKILIVHGGQTFNDLKTSFQDLKAKEYYAAGQELGQIYQEMIAKQQELLQQQSQQLFSVSDIKQEESSMLLKISQFYEGYLEGLGLTVPDILGCISGDLNEKNTLDQISNIFYTEKSTFGKIKALKYIFQVLKYLPEALSQCDSGKDDILFAQRSMKSFLYLFFNIMVYNITPLTQNQNNNSWLKSPISTLEMIFKNIQDEKIMIMQQINQSFEYLKSDENRFAGFQLGSAFRELFLQKTAETNN